MTAPTGGSSSTRRSRAGLVERKLGNKRYFVLMHVAMFITCFNDTMFPSHGPGVVSLLERLGHTVDFPMAQTCCGQMHYNTGYQRETSRWCGTSWRFSAMRDDRLAIALVRGDGPRGLSQGRGSGRGRIAGTRCRRADSPSPRVLDVPGAQAGRRRRRRVLSAPCHLPPDLPLTADMRIGDAPQRLLARSGESTWWNCHMLKSAAASAVPSR